MKTEIAPGIFKISFDSNCYLVGDVVIDTCPRKFKDEVAKEIGDLGSVKKVIFTHLHYDHCGNADLFPNAKFFASAAAIEDYERDKAGTVLGDAPELKLNELESFGDFEVIPVPGHTRGSVALLYKDILFTGDTWFGNGVYGRVDLPTSVPDQMEGSLAKLKKIKFKVLCPGHDYVSSGKKV